MSSNSAENAAGQSLLKFQQELVQTIRSGQRRTVIISLDEEGLVQSMFFPLDDLKMRGQMDMAAVELVGLSHQEDHPPERTLFGHLRVDKNGQLLVVNGSDAMARPSDEKVMTELLQSYFTGTVNNSPLKQLEEPEA